MGWKKQCKNILVITTLDSCVWLYFMHIFHVSNFPVCGFFLKNQSDSFLLVRAKTVKRGPLWDLLKYISFYQPSMWHSDTTTHTAIAKNTYFKNGYKVPYTSTPFLRQLQTTKMITKHTKYQNMTKKRYIWITYMIVKVLIEVNINTGL